MINLLLKFTFYNLPGRILDCIYALLINTTVTILYSAVSLGNFVLDTNPGLVYIEGKRVYGYYERL